MAGRPFPLDNQFRYLQAEVEKTQAAFEKLRASLGGGGGAAGAAPTVNVGRAPFEGAGTGRDDRRRFVELARFGKEATKSVQELSRAAKGAGNLAKILGFEEAAAGFEKTAIAAERVHTVLEGVGAVAKIAALAFKPLAVVVGAAALAFGTVAAGAAAFQQAIKAATGATLSLGNAVKVAGLGLVRGIGSAIAFVVEKVPLIETAFRLLPDAIRQVMASLAEAVIRKFGDLTTSLGALLAKLPERFRPDGIIQGLNAVGESAGRFAEGLRAVISEGDAAGKAALAAAKQRGAAIKSDADAAIAAIDAVVSEAFDEKAGTDIFEDPMKALKEFTDAIRDGIPDAAKDAAAKAAKALDDALTKLKEEEDKKNKDKNKERKEDYRSAGQGVGEAFGDGVQQGLDASKWHGHLQQQLQTLTFDRAFIEQLIVSPDDQTKIINSFSDLIRNVKSLFRQNRFGFIASLLGAQGVFGAPRDGGAQSFQGIGFAEGGRVGRGGAASPAHLFARGFADGGRPAGLAPSDTVPAWLTPGEWVQPLAAVQHYGSQVMEGLRTLSIPRGPLLALADGLHVPQTVRAPAPRSAPRGYAAGGMVAGGGEPAAPVVVPAIVADERTLGRMLEGGGNQMKRWLRDNGYGPGR